MSILAMSAPCNGCFGYSFHCDVRQRSSMPLLTAWNGLWHREAWNSSSTIWTTTQLLAPVCQKALDTLAAICKELGVPLAPEKQDGPSTLITFLGILIDTIKQELRLPKDKLRRLLETVSQWEGKKTCTRRELESLIGTLHHACKVIPAGRSFMRRAIELLSVARRRHHHIRLNKEIRSDLAWWKVFASNWNGASLVTHSNSEQIHMTSDASRSWGYGAWHGSKWFQLP